MMIPARIPVRIASIQLAGGACPYQIEATTDDGQYFYLRYRWGRLRAGVAQKEEGFLHGKDNYNVIDKVVDPTGWEGWAHHEELAPYLDGFVIFPDDFRLDSYTEAEMATWLNDEKNDNVQNNSTGSGERQD